MSGSTTSLAAVFRSSKEPLSMERFPVPVPAGGEAVVRIRFATICGSDLHSRFGRRPCPTPCVLGHEMVGEIAIVGPEGVRDFRGAPLVPGDRITWSMLWSCGECFFCRRELRSKCERLMKFGHELIAPGQELRGGMAEYCHLPAGTAIFRVPPNLPDAVVSPANCATATVAAAFRAADGVEGEVVAIHGAGMLGLTACAMAAERGAARVIAIEPVPRRRKLALRFGANAAIDSRLPLAEIAAPVKEATAGRGADVALELSGYPESVELSLNLLRTGGRLIMAGSTFPARPLHLSGERLVRRMTRVAGVYNYEPEDLESALGFLEGAAARFPFEELVGAEWTLAEANHAMAFAETERPPRVGLITR
jgi:putative phosphonate catabolism associated alcohol dehydrogenase